MAGKMTTMLRNGDGGEEAYVKICRQTCKRAAGELPKA